MSKALKRAIIAPFLLFLLYCLLGFLILPGIALRTLNQELAEYAQVPTRLERLEFNPLTLELNLWGLHLGQPGAEQAGFKALSVDLAFDSLWLGYLHLTRIELDRPYAEVLLTEDGRLNLSQLFKLPPPATESAQTTQKPLPIYIESIRLQQGRVHFLDRRPSSPVEFLFDPLGFELRNLSTLPNGDAKMTLTAIGPHGGQLDWEGDLSLMPFTSKGQLSIQKVPLKAWWPYVRDNLPLNLQSGQLGLSTHYQLDLSRNLLQLDQAALSLQDLSLHSPQDKPLLKLASLDISETQLDLSKRQLVVGQIRSQGLEAWAAREKNGQLDWQKLFANFQPYKRPTASPAPVQAAASPQEPKPAWQVLLKDSQLLGYKAHLRDLVPSTPVALEVGPLDLQLRNLDSLRSTPLQFNLKTLLGAHGKLTAQGDFHPGTLQAKVDVISQDIDLRIAQAYLKPFVRLELRSGFLANNLHLELHSLTPLAFNLSGSLNIKQLHTLDSPKERDFIKWASLDLQGLNYQHGNSLAIHSLTLEQPYVRFVINEDRSTNLSELMVPQAAPAQKASPGKPLKIHIGQISFNKGSANFADQSLRPNFATAIQQLTGSIGTLDNQSKQPAAVSIQGKVDQYAPVSIQGNLTPFSPLEKLDITTRFKKVELTTLTPYSGKFAGYRIHKGRISLDLHYQITQGQLKAHNQVLVEHLQLGEKVESPQAVDLPVKLAVALLKDAQGNIDLQLPVTGDLNNPQFSVMPIVWQTLRNLLVRAVQAPFKFIAGLGEGEGPDLSSLPFAAGSSELQPSTQDNLRKVAEALKQRPALKLEVEGISANSDGPPLAEARLQEEYRRLYYSMLQRSGEKLPDDAAHLEVPEDLQIPMLEGIYRSQLAKQPPQAWQDLDSEERGKQLRQAVLEAWRNDELYLRKLAQERAAAIKGYLVNQGLAAERIYLIDVKIEASQGGDKVVTQLHLDSE